MAKKDAVSQSGADADQTIGRVSRSTAAASGGSGIPPRPELMAVLNVTPDSFSDGGRFEGAPSDRTSQAVAAARRAIEEGATIIDVGGESTRPGAERVPQPEERARVVPVVKALVEQNIRVSVDTMYAATAAECLELGDVIINDVSGGLADPDMLATVAAYGAEFILSHWRGHSLTMNDFAVYDDPARDMLTEIRQMRDRAVAHGIAPERIILDPGLGFAKDRDDNWAILNQLEQLADEPHRILIGVSRKRFMGALLPDDAPMNDRDLPSAIVAALAAERGVWGVRAHNVAATRTAFDVVDAWRHGAQLTTKESA